MSLLLVAFDVQLKDGWAIFTYRQARPCLTRPVTASRHRYEPFEGVQVVGPASLSLGTLVPEQLAVCLDPALAPALRLANLPPFTFLVEAWQFQTQSLGALADKCRKQFNIQD